MSASRPMLLAALLVGCSGASSAGTAASTTPEPEAIPSPSRPWAEMPHAERQAWMALEVAPRMAALFQEYDAERYADFSCPTCHGQDAQARGFEMPNPGLYALSPTGSEGQHRTVREHPEMVRFMYNRVVPAMQTLTGAHAFDETTGEGFTCYACHPHAAE